MNYRPILLSALLVTGAGFSAFTRDAETNSTQSLQSRSKISADAPNVCDSPQTMMLAANTEAPLPNKGDLLQPGIPPQPKITEVLSTLRRKVNTALQASDYPAAERLVDEALTSASWQAYEKQQIMIVKMASYGMRGDRAAMITLIDEIITMDPSSATARLLYEQRPQFVQSLQRDQNHTEQCKTCFSFHENSPKSSVSTQSR